MPLERKHGKSRGNPQAKKGGRLSHPVLPDRQIWRCADCEFLLAYLNKERDVARVKYKDLYVEIGRAEWVKITCRRCGLVNSVDADSD